MTRKIEGLGRIARSEREGTRVMKRRTAVVLMTVVGTLAGGLAWGVNANAAAPVLPMCHAPSDPVYSQKLAFALQGTRYRQMSARWQLPGGQIVQVLETTNALSRGTAEGSGTPIEACFVPAP